MKLTPGKLKGLKAVADKRGVIAAAAMDQRGSLQKALGKERGGDIGDAMMEEFKAMLLACVEKPLPEIYGDLRAKTMQIGKQTDDQTMLLLRKLS